MEDQEEGKKVLLVLPQELIDDLEEVRKEIRAKGGVQKLGKVTRSRVVQLAVERYIQKFRETGEI